MKNILLISMLIIFLLPLGGCETARGVGSDIRSAASTVGSVLSVGRQIEDIAN